MSGMGLSGARIAGRLPAQDLDRARRWYAEKLGLEPVEERPGGLLYVLGGAEFALFHSSGQADGSFTQFAFSVPDLESTVAELRQRGVVFEDYGLPGQDPDSGIVPIEGNYPSKGTGERAVWFRDSEGNMFGLSEPVR